MQIVSLPELHFALTFSVENIGPGPTKSDKLFFDSIRYQYDMRVFLSIRYDTIRYEALGEAGGKSRKCSMGKVGTSVDSSTGGKVVGTGSSNGGLVGGDDRSVSSRFL